MTTVTVNIEPEHLEKLEAMVKSGQAANISHAMRLCINAFPFAVKEVKNKN